MNKQQIKEAEEAEAEQMRGLIVEMREDGLHVIDGQHRLNAALEILRDFDQRKSDREGRSTGTDQEVGGVVPHALRPVQ